MARATRHHHYFINSEFNLAYWIELNWNELKRSSDWSVLKFTWRIGFCASNFLRGLKWVRQALEVESNIL